jgi:hypothetical protein
MYYTKKDNIEFELERFLNKIIIKKFPEVNHIVVLGAPAKISFGNFYYNIRVNPSFYGIKELGLNPSLEREIFDYILNTSEFGCEMFKKCGRHFIHDIRWFYN